MAPHEALAEPRHVFARHHEMAGVPWRHRLEDPFCGGKEPSRMTARRFAINVLIFVGVMIVISAIAIWLNLGPVVGSTE